MEKEKERAKSPSNMLAMVGNASLSLTAWNLIPFFRQLKEAFPIAYRNSVRPQLWPTLGVAITLNKLSDFSVTGVPYLGTLSIVGRCC